MTIFEFLAARIETDRGEAQYTLNLLESSAPVMLGSLRGTIIHTSQRVLADVEAKRAIIELHTGRHACGHWPTGCPTIKRLAEDYADHADYQAWLGPAARRPLRTVAPVTDLFDRIDFSNATWRCMVCGDERPDPVISVMTLPVLFNGTPMPGASYNLKYCNDRTACTEKALAHGPYRLGKP